MLLNCWLWTYICLFGNNTEKEKENDKYCKYIWDIESYSNSETNNTGEQIIQEII